MLTANQVAALQNACPQNHGEIPGAIGRAGSDGQAIANAINAVAGLSKAADVAANSAAAAVTVPDNTQASINTALASVIADLNATRTQINAILTALKNAGLMS